MISITRAIILAVVACTLSAGTAAPVAQTPPERLVAVGDVHGSLDSLVAILRAAGLTDAQDRWIGGRARLVQTGDFLDRGPADREVMELLMRLEDEAKRAGGRVEVLFGNHEGMNILHDFRDVSPEAFRSFSDAESESRRARGLSAQAAVARRLRVDFDKDAWLRDHPPGYIEYAEAMGPKHRFGRWLRARKVVAKIDDSIFMHAGISPDLTASIDTINRTVEREIRTFDAAASGLQHSGLITPFFTLQELLTAAATELNRVSAPAAETADTTLDRADNPAVRQLMSLNQWMLVAAQGPLWFRGYAQLGEDAQPRIEALLKRYGAARFIVGHTPQLPAGRITPRFNGRVFLIDTGMLTTHYKGGRPSALELANGQITAIYTDERQPLISPTAGSR